MAVERDGRGDGRGVRGRRAGQVQALQVEGGEGCRAVWRQAHGFDGGVGGGVDGCCWGGEGVGADGAGLGGGVECRSGGLAAAVAVVSAGGWGGRCGGDGGGVGAGWEVFGSECEVGVDGQAVGTLGSPGGAGGVGSDGEGVDGQVVGIWAPAAVEHVGRAVVRTIVTRGDYEGFHGWRGGLRGGWVGEGRVSFGRGWDFAACLDGIGWGGGLRDGWVRRWEVAAVVGREFAWCLDVHDLL